MKTGVREKGALRARDAVQRPLTEGVQRGQVNVQGTDRGFQGCSGWGLRRSATAAGDSELTRVNEHLHDGLLADIQDGVNGRMRAENANSLHDNAIPAHILRQLLHVQLRSVAVVMSRNDRSPKNLLLDARSVHFEGKKRSHLLHAHREGLDIQQGHCTEESAALRQHRNGGELGCCSVEGERRGAVGLADSAMEGVVYAHLLVSDLRGHPRWSPVRMNLHEAVERCQHSLAPHAALREDQLPDPLPQSQAPLLDCLAGLVHGQGLHHCLGHGERRREHGEAIGERQAGAHRQRRPKSGEVLLRSEHRPVPSVLQRYIYLILNSMILKSVRRADTNVNWALLNGTMLKKMGSLENETSNFLRFTDFPLASVDQT